MRLNIKIIVFSIIILIIILHINNYHDDNDHHNNDIHRRMFEGSEPFQYHQYYSIRSYISRYTKSLIRRRLIKELVKASGKSIYVVEDGVLHHIPDWDTFIAYGFDLHNVKYIRYIIIVVILSPLLLS